MSRTSASPKSHAELCSLAVRWLRSPHGRGGPGCQIAYGECRPGRTGEIPDAIGFRSAGWIDGSIVVECKTSRADFIADRAKPHRRSAGGMGTWRYYLCPEGLIAPDELPERWGLLLVLPRGAVRAVRGPAAALAHHSGSGHEQRRYAEISQEWACEANLVAERSLLVGLLARVGDSERFNRLLRDARRAADLAQGALDGLRNPAATSGD